MTLPHTFFPSNEHRRTEREPPGHGGAFERTSRELRAKAFISESVCSCRDVLRLRPIFTRGRTSGKAIHEADLREQADKIVTLLNGDWRKPLFTHYCQNCCQGPADCAGKIVALIGTAFI